MAVYRTFAALLLIAVLTVVAAQRRFITTRPKLPSDKVCRGEFDCRDPEECLNGYCVRLPSFCRWPGKPYFGNIHPDIPQYDFSTTIEFSCNPGYRLVGQKTSLCKDDGKWSREKPRCVATRCANPGRPYRGLLRPEKEWYQLGETVQISCKSYYVISGSKTSRCREDGTWSNELPECSKPDGV